MGLPNEDTIKYYVALTLLCIQDASPARRIPKQSYVVSRYQSTQMGEITDTNDAMNRRRGGYSIDIPQIFLHYTLACVLEMPRYNVT